MAGHYNGGRPASPIQIATPPRFNSQSPRTSNLTSALQNAVLSGQQSDAINIGGKNPSDGRMSIGARQNSLNNGMGSYFGGSGARPISVKDRQRRESQAGSLSNGMSWGGISVGSWIRDDIMTGTSPYAFQQSPSFHSSSYLPKLEANFMRDFACCGLTLDSLHDLLQHYETAHAEPNAQVNNRPSISGQGGYYQNGRNGSIGFHQSRSSMQPSSQYHGFESNQNIQMNNMQSYQSSGLGNSTFSRTPLATVPDVDPLDSMDMDDAPFQLDQPQQTTSNSQPSPFGHMNNGMPPLNVNVANTMQQHRGLKKSSPTTPNAGHQAFGLQNNPTVSSVNTPTFGNQALQNAQSQISPYTSQPGTPGELDPDFAQNYAAGMPLGPPMATGNDLDWSKINAMGNDAPSQFIDDPAKRLYSKQGGYNQQQLQALRIAQMGGNTQQTTGLNGAALGFPAEEEKPFKCPVHGCEKAYKNQNGLKYHKVHGHRNQQLQANEDGSYSIVDPITSVPYPGTVGMEKEKPYRCEVCGKRYKNLNGLKYHRQHSPPCNPELRINPTGGPVMPVNLGGMNVNVAGSGLPGMGL
ncbi:hypothetical protein W97_08713 [Coniosporium apollinis CBS 100218]|uniref:C2H2-type domain-containing protein n=1 Tax=Coniosporium apollinis (strain CBS 100218) TaxID=1168221 RepID=R7Z5S1_CONA1|nr:uncharacterized protein W97_08713 [Coniosporium apollinis CBS 100218]EON69453.1 hypothetical protein W97_08713 [Coniosporium apollinis CBS 100218]